MKYGIHALWCTLRKKNPRDSWKDEACCLIAFLTNTDWCLTLVDIRKSVLFSFSSFQIGPFVTNIQFTHFYQFFKNKLGKHISINQIQRSSIPTAKRTILHHLPAIICTKIGFFKNKKIGGEEGGPNAAWTLTVLVQYWGSTWLLGGEHSNPRLWWVNQSISVSFTLGHIYAQMFPFWIWTLTNLRGGERKNELAFIPDLSLPETEHGHQLFRIDSSIKLYIDTVLFVILLYVVSILHRNNY